MMINDFYIYSRWEQLNEKIKSDIIYQDNRYRIEALSFDWYNQVFLANNIKGDKKILIEFEKKELIGYIPIQINGLEIFIDDYHQISSSKTYLQISLANLALEEAFLAFTTSILLNIQKSNSSLETIKIIEKIIKKYTEFFSKKTKYTLSDIQEQGLYAELYELSNLLNIYGEEAVRSWEGPEKRRRDYIFNEFEIEVKSSTNLSNISATITSKNQLEPIDKPLYLHLHVLEKSNTGNTILDLIDIIINKIISIQYKKIFIGKLFLLGIDKDEYEAKSNYRIISTTRYVINDSFPRIKSQNVPEEVFEIKYKIDLKLIKGEELHYDKI